MYKSYNVTFFPHNIFCSKSFSLIVQFVKAPDIQIHKSATDKATPTSANQFSATEVAHLKAC